MFVANMMLDTQGKDGNGEGSLRRTANPTAVPKATGNKIDAAGWAKIAAGRVREGIKVVMIAILLFIVRGHS